MMRRSPSSRYSPHTAATSGILIWTLAGYPALAALVAHTDLPSQAASIPVRSIVFLSALWLILRTPYRLPRPPRNVWAICFIAFVGIYLLRLAFDLASNVPGTIFNASFFLVAALVPAIAVARLPIEYFEEARVAKYLAGLGAVALGATLLGDVASVDVERSLLDATGRLSLDILNPITLGHVAVSTLIAVSVLVRERNVTDMPWLIVGGAALQVLHMTASRGPVVALALVLLVWALFASSAAARMAVIAIGTFAVSFGATLIAEEPELLGRFGSIGEDPSSVERILLQESALRQFLENPLTGSAHVELESLTYPHNTVFEAAMATGVIGVALFGLLLIGILVEIVRRLFRGDRLVPLLALQYLVASQLSGALFASADFWVLAAIMVLAPDREKQFETRACSQ